MSQISSRLNDQISSEDASLMHHRSHHPSNGLPPLSDVAGASESHGGPLLPLLFNRTSSVPLTNFDDSPCLSKHSETSSSFTQSSAPVCALTSIDTLGPLQRVSSSPSHQGRPSPTCSSTSSHILSRALAPHVRIDRVSRLIEERSRISSNSSAKSSSIAPLPSPTRDASTNGLAHAPHTRKWCTTHMDTPHESPQALPMEHGRTVDSTTPPSPLPLFPASTSTATFTHTPSSLDSHHIDSDHGPDPGSAWGRTVPSTTLFPSCPRAPVLAPVPVLTAPLPTTETQGMSSLPFVPVSAASSGVVSVSAPEPTHTATHTATRDYAAADAATGVAAASSAVATAVVKTPQEAVAALPMVLDEVPVATSTLPTSVTPFTSTATPAAPAPRVAAASTPVSSHAPSAAPVASLMPATTRSYPNEASAPGSVASYPSSAQSHTHAQVPTHPQPSARVYAAAGCGADSVHSHVSGNGGGGVRGGVGSAGVGVCDSTYDSVYSSNYIFSHARTHACAHTHAHAHPHQFQQQHSHQYHQQHQYRQQEHHQHRQHPYHQERSQQHQQLQPRSSHASPPQASPPPPFQRRAHSHCHLPTSPSTHTRTSTSSAHTRASARSHTRSLSQVLTPYTRPYLYPYLHPYLLTPEDVQSHVRAHDTGVLTEATCGICMATRDADGNTLVSNLRKAWSKARSRGRGRQTGMSTGNLAEDDLYGTGTSTSTGLSMGTSESDLYGMGARDTRTHNTSHSRQLARIHAHTSLSPHAPMAARHARAFSVGFSTHGRGYPSRSDFRTVAPALASSMHRLERELLRNMLKYRLAHRPAQCAYVVDSHDAQGVQAAAYVSSQQTELHGVLARRLVEMMGAHMTRGDRDSECFVHADDANGDGGEGGSTDAAAVNGTGAGALVGTHDTWPSIHGYQREYHEYEYRVSTGASPRVRGVVRVTDSRSPRNAAVTSTSTSASGFTLGSASAHACSPASAAASHSAATTHTATSTAATTASGGLQGSKCGRAVDAEAVAGANITEKAVQESENAESIEEVEEIEQETEDYQCPMCGYGSARLRYVSVAELLEIVQCAHAARDARDSARLARAKERPERDALRHARGSVRGVGNANAIGDVNRVNDGVGGAATMSAATTTTVAATAGATARPAAVAGVQGEGAVLAGDGETDSPQESQEGVEHYYTEVTGDSRGDGVYDGYAEDEDEDEDEYLWSDDGGDGEHARACEGEAEAAVGEGAQGRVRMRRAKEVYTPQCVCRIPSRKWRAMPYALRGALLAGAVLGRGLGSDRDIWEASLALWHAVDNSLESKGRSHEYVAGMGYALEDVATAVEQRLRRAAQCREHGRLDFLMETCACEAALRQAYRCGYRWGGGGRERQSAGAGIGTGMGMGADATEDDAVEHALAAVSVQEIGLWRRRGYLIALEAEEREAQAIEARDRTRVQRACESAMGVDESVGREHDGEAGEDVSSDGKNGSRKLSHPLPMVVIPDSQLVYHNSVRRRGSSGPHPDFVAIQEKLRKPQIPSRVDSREVDVKSIVDTRAIFTDVIVVPSPVFCNDVSTIGADNHDVYVDGNDNAMAGMSTLPANTHTIPTRTSAPTTDLAAPIAATATNIITTAASRLTADTTTTLVPATTYTAHAPASHAPPTQPRQHYPHTRDTGTPSVGVRVYRVQEGSEAVEEVEEGEMRDDVEGEMADGEETDDDNNDKLDDRNDDHDDDNDDEMVDQGTVTYHSNHHDDGSDDTDNDEHDDNNYNSDNNFDDDTDPEEDSELDFLLESEDEREREYHHIQARTEHHASHTTAAHPHEHSVEYNSGHSLDHRSQYRGDQAHIHTLGLCVNDPHENSPNFAETTVDSGKPPFDYSESEEVPKYPRSVYSHYAQTLPLTIPASPTVPATPCSVAMSSYLGEDATEGVDAGDGADAVYEGNDAIYGGRDAAVYGDVRVAGAGAGACVECEACVVCGDEQRQRLRGSDDGVVHESGHDVLAGTVEDRLIVQSAGDGHAGVGDEEAGDAYTPLPRLPQRSPGTHALRSTHTQTNTHVHVHAKPQAHVSAANVAGEDNGLGASEGDGSATKALTSAPTARAGASAVGVDMATTAEAATISLRAPVLGPAASVCRHHHTHALSGVPVRAPPRLGHAASNLVRPTHAHAHAHTAGHGHAHALSSAGAGINVSVNVNVGGSVSGSAGSARVPCHPHTTTAVCRSRGWGWGRAVTREVEEDARTAAQADARAQSKVRKGDTETAVETAPRGRAGVEDTATERHKHECMSVGGVVSRESVSGRAVAGAPMSMVMVAGSPVCTADVTHAGFDATVSADVHARDMAWGGVGKIAQANTVSGPTNTATALHTSPHTATIGSAPTLTANAMLPTLTSAAPLLTAHAMCTTHASTAPAFTTNTLSAPTFPHQGATQPHTASSVNLMSEGVPQPQVTLANAHGDTREGATQPLAALAVDFRVQRDDSLAALAQQRRKKKGKGGLSSATAVSASTQGGSSVADVSAGTGTGTGGGDSQPFVFTLPSYSAAASPTDTTTVASAAPTVASAGASTMATPPAFVFRMPIIAGNAATSTAPTTAAQAVATTSTTTTASPASFVFDRSKLPATNTTTATVTAAAAAAAVAGTPPSTATSAAAAVTTGRGTAFVLQPIPRAATDTVADTATDLVTPQITFHLPPHTDTPLTLPLTASALHQRDDDVLNVSHASGNTVDVGIRELWTLPPTQFSHKKKGKDGKLGKSEKSQDLGVSTFVFRPVSVAQAASCSTADESTSMDATMQRPADATYLPVPATISASRTPADSVPVPTLPTMPTTFMAQAPTIITTTVDATPMPTSVPAVNIGFFTPPPPTRVTAVPVPNNSFSCPPVRPFRNPSRASGNIDQPSGENLLSTGVERPLFSEEDAPHANAMPSPVLFPCSSSPPPPPAQQPILAFTSSSPGSIPGVHPALTNNTTTIAEPAAIAAEPSSNDDYPVTTDTHASLSSNYTAYTASQHTVAAYKAVDPVYGKATGGPFLQSLRNANLRVRVDSPQSSVASASFHCRANDFSGMLGQVQAHANGHGQGLSPRLLPPLPSDAIAATYTQPIAQTLPPTHEQAQAQTQRHVLSHGLTAVVGSTATGDGTGMGASASAGTGDGVDVGVGLGAYGFSSRDTHSNAMYTANAGGNVGTGVSSRGDSGGGSGGGGAAEVAMSLHLHHDAHDRGAETWQQSLTNRYAATTADYTAAQTLPPNYMASQTQPLQCTAADASRPRPSTSTAVVSVSGAPRASVGMGASGGMGLSVGKEEHILANAAMAQTHPYEALMRDKLSTAHADNRDDSVCVLSVQDALYEVHSVPRTTTLTQAEESPLLPYPHQYQYPLAAPQHAGAHVYSGGMLPPSLAALPYNHTLPHAHIMVQAQLQAQMQAQVQAQAIAAHARAQPQAETVALLQAQVMSQAAALSQAQTHAHLLSTLSLDAATKSQLQTQAQANVAMQMQALTQAQTLLQQQMDAQALLHAQLQVQLQATALAAANSTIQHLSQLLQLAYTQPPVHTHPNSHHYMSQEGTLQPQTSTSIPAAEAGADARADAAPVSGVAASIPRAHPSAHIHTHAHAQTHAQALVAEVATASAALPAFATSNAAGMSAVPAVAPLLLPTSSTAASATASATAPNAGVLAQLPSSVMASPQPAAAHLPMGMPRSIPLTVPMHVSGSFPLSLPISELMPVAIPGAPELARPPLQYIPSQHAHTTSQHMHTAVADTAPQPAALHPLGHQQPYQYPQQLHHNHQHQRTSLSLSGAHNVNGVHSLGNVPNGTTTATGPMGMAATLAPAASAPAFTTAAPAPASAPASALPADIAAILSRVRGFADKTLPPPAPAPAPGHLQSAAAVHGNSAGSMQDRNVGARSGHASTAHTATSAIATSTPASSAQTLERSHEHTHEHTQFPVAPMSASAPLPPLARAPPALNVVTSPLLSVHSPPHSPAQSLALLHAAPKPVPPSPQHSVYARSIAASERGGYEPVRANERPSEVKTQNVDMDVARDGEVGQDVPLHHKVAHEQAMQASATAGVGVDGGYPRVTQISLQHGGADATHAPLENKPVSENAPHNSQSADSSQHRGDPGAPHSAESLPTSSSMTSNGVDESSVLLATPPETSRVTSCLTGSSAALSGASDARARGQALSLAASGSVVVSSATANSSREIESACGHVLSFLDVEPQRRQTQLFYLMRILLRACTHLCADGLISQGQKLSLKDLIVDNDAFLLRIAYEYDQDGDVAKFRNALCEVAKRR